MAPLTHTDQIMTSEGVATVSQVHDVMYVYGYFPAFTERLLR